MGDRDVKRGKLAMETNPLELWTPNVPKRASRCSALEKKERQKVLPSLRDVEVSSSALDKKEHHDAPSLRGVAVNVRNCPRRQGLSFSNLCISHRDLPTARTL